MRRRGFVALLAAAAVFPEELCAQHGSNRLRQIGYLGLGATVPFLQNALREGLREHGWIEGANIAIDRRFAEGKYDRLPGLAAELVQRNVEVVVASPTPAALAASAAGGPNAAMTVTRWSTNSAASVGTRSY